MPYEKILFLLFYFITSLTSPESAKHNFIDLREAIYTRQQSIADVEHNDRMRLAKICRTVDHNGRFKKRNWV